MITSSVARRSARRVRHLLPAAFVLFVLSASGCSTVYSPFAALPAAPMAAGDGAVSATVNILPETRPEGSLASDLVSPGGELLIRYAFSNRVTLQARTWSRIDRSLAINGASLDGLYTFSDAKDPVRYGLQARAVMMFDGQELVGRAALVSGVAWFPDLWIVKPYLGLGGGVGDYIGSYRGEEANQWGYVLINNIGGNVELFGDFSANLELVNMMQVNRFDHTISTMALLPSLSLVWSF